MRITVHANKNYCEAYEYWCNRCGTLNLSFVQLDGKCGECNSTDIVIGKIGELNKEELTKNFRDK